MATVPSGSIVAMVFPYYEGAIATVLGSRVAMDAAAPTVLSTCPSSVRAQSESEGGRVLSLDNGQFAVSVSGVLTLYSNSGFRVASTILSAADFYYGLLGTDHTAVVWVGGYDAGDITVSSRNIDTGAIILARTPYVGPTVPSVLCIDGIGEILYTLLLTGVTPTLQAYDLAGDAPLADIITWAAAAPYPIAGFALRDGRLVLEFSDDSLQLIDQTDGSTILTFDEGPIVGNDPLFAGVDDTTIWAGHDGDLFECSTTTGTVSTTWTLPASVSGAGMGMIVYAAQASFEGCTQPPTPAEVDRDIKRVRRFSLPSLGMQPMIWHALQIDMETGVGTRTGADTDPLVWLRYSDDDGHTWSQLRSVPAGRRGAYTVRAIFRNLGRSVGLRRFELSVSAHVPWTFLQALADVSRG